MTKLPVTNTVSYWRNLARSYLVAVSSEDAEKVAERCAAINIAGGITSLWHESANHFGHHCNCTVCNPTAPKPLGEENA